MKLETPINLKIFFCKPKGETANITYNHYGIIEKENLPGNWLRLVKNNNEEVIINLNNVNQIVSI